MTEYTGGIHNPGDGNMSHRREIFVNSSTWVQRAIGNGYVSQVLFLPQGSIYSNDKPFRMTLLDVIPGVHKIKGMDRKRERSCPTQGPRQSPVLRSVPMHRKIISDHEVS